MVILVLANSDGGLVSFRKELLTTLSKRYRVVCATPSGDRTTQLIETGCEHIEVPVSRRGINPAKDFMLIMNYLRIIRKFKPAIVLSYTIKPNIYGGFACRLMHVPYLANVTGLGTALENGGLLKHIAATLYRIGLHGASCVFFQNQANKVLFETKGITKGKTRLIPGSGVNINDHVFKEYPSTDNGIRFLFIGRVMRDKGINELLDAIKAVHKCYSQVSLDIVGGFDEDFSTVMDEAEKTGYIHYHGRQPHVHEFIENAHCTVLPSYHEGTANVLLESASTGRPVISCLIPGCQETFDDGVTGLGCEVKNVQSLVDAMEKFIELPFEKKVEMGYLGREKMIREYDRSIVINAYLEEIQNIVKEKK